MEWESEILQACRRLKIMQPKPLQISILKKLLGRRSVVANLPSGYGKSLCYQAIPIITQKPILIVSPLIALIEDQMEKLRVLRLPAYFYHKKIKSDSQAGESCYHFTTPESMINPSLFSEEMLTTYTHIVFDEIHCISLWGKDFRPAYLHIFEKYPSLKKACIYGLSATILPQTKEEISHLFARTITWVTYPMHLPNIRIQSIRLEDESDKYEWLLRWIHDLEKPMLIYCQTIFQVMRLYRFLKTIDSQVVYYHSQAGSSKRNHQRIFNESDNGIMVATNAFGLGIDKKDIRSLIHFNPPLSFEHYYQEIGRSGRDGAPAVAILLFSIGDSVMNEHLLDTTKIFPSIRQIKQVWQRLSKRRVQSFTMLGRQCTFSLKILQHILYILNRANLVDHNEQGWMKTQYALNVSKLPIVLQTTFKNVVKWKQFYRAVSHEKFGWETLAGAFGQKILAKHLLNPTTTAEIGSGHLLTDIGQIHQVASFLEQETTRIQATRYHRIGFIASTYKNDELGWNLALWKYPKRSSSCKGAVAQQTVREMEIVEMLKGSLVQCFLKHHDIFPSKGYITALPSQHLDDSWQDLCRWIAEQLGLSYLAFFTPHPFVMAQKYIANPLKRRLHSECRFLFPPDIPDDFPNPKERAEVPLFLVDDIYDTGASIREAAKILHKYGWKQIIPFVLARTHRFQPETVFSIEYTKTFL